MKIVDQEIWEDFKSCQALNTNYVTSEPFQKWEVDLRIQKIGNHYRVFERKSKDWKSNASISTTDSEGTLHERYKTWIDEASKELKMDITAMDVIVDEKGNEFILEINSSAIGLNPKCQDEDAIVIRDLVVRKFEENYKKDKEIKEEKIDEFSNLSKETMALKIKELESELLQMKLKLENFQKQQTEQKDSDKEKEKEKSKSFFQEK
eukprot:TRINITY_DN12496_c0_g1_i1.p1 TRINITY_DN12496_c0_g1~~TRINITY_DN12496_c0_g1_i1.p1  ORF type:complete len:207 (-),score=69.63 TRINITY_DN12496_c0_g1_i1:19-639(-)